MWMMGYGGDDKGLSNSVNNIKLQPLVKRTKTTTHSPISTAYASNGHLVATETDRQSTREKNADPVVSSRWNPTREQIQVLEEMYRGGIRTPTAEQIQKIVGKLRRFGRIEGKNIFYWFQNHKARERQKRRRLLESSCGGLRDIDKVGKQDLVLSKRGLEDVQKHKWVTPSNCSTISEESVSIHRAVIAECKAEKRIQVEERELQERDKHSVTGCEDESRKFQTLQLFPISRGIRDDCNVVDGVNNDAKIPINTIATNFNPVQFFEFLPLKD